MKIHLIKLPQVLVRELINSLRRNEAVLLHGVGTIYITEYRKKNHPSLVSEGTYSLKAKKLSRINFKPHKELKNAI